MGCRHLVRAQQSIGLFAKSLGQRRFCNVFRVRFSFESSQAATTLNLRGQANKVQNVIGMRVVPTWANYCAVCRNRRKCGMDHDQ
ncbi:hypothetical protein CJO92_20625 (plasmid) [Ralstonia solanacearum]|uniref:Uncharacterized protein n=1 Tax=Ralstonia solanacearum TaxID=305 RepID=A0AAD0SBH9_RALSL|nr:hypothetical protein CJO77_20615 [Ralstonia solanacearum]AXW55084.1 hypothetical protein CJO92_20625 [Ralstonia solanacearum]CBM10565.1 protein of unknown function [Ralstonia solanacearum PSI07]